MQDLTEAELAQLERMAESSKVLSWTREIYIQSTNATRAQVDYANAAMRAVEPLIAEVRRLRAAMEPAKGGRLYAQRDSDSLGAHYIGHVNAMTAEGLHEKSAIAAELAWRDVQITELRGQLADEQRLRKEYGF